MSRRLFEFKTSLNSEIQNAITAAVTVTVLSPIQNTLDMQGRANFPVVDRESNGLHVGPRKAIFTVEDRRSSGLQQNPEAENSQKTWDNRPSRQMSRESSVDSYNSEQKCDK